MWYRMALQSWGVVIREETSEPVTCTSILGLKRGYMLWKDGNVVIISSSYTKSLRTLLINIKVCNLVNYICSQAMS